MFEEMERVKLKFLAAFEGLHRQGVISEDELAEYIDMVDKLDELTVDEIRAKLSRFLGESDDEAAGR
ncbi:MAG: hypothetical protein FWJ73_05045 [Limnochordales bacterium]|nr:hypothetical protein [Bacillota bacterium]